jgi:uroporphyrinogen-III decarboxylase
VGADLIGWVYGLQKMIYAVYDQPELLQELLDIIFRWNQSRMEVVLNSGIDLYIKRAWYENCDFWSPGSWRKYVFPLLKEDASLAHARGSKFGYMITSNCMPLLDGIVEAGVDVAIGVDPLKWDLPITKAKLAGKVCIWGGVNGHLTVEQGSQEMVRAEVRTALNVLSPGSGFILSPVDNVRENTELSWQNVNALIDEWKRSNDRRE